MTSAARSSRSATIARVHSSAMTHLPHGWQLAIKLLAQLANQFTFRPGKPMIVERDRKHVLLMPPIALDLFRVTAIAAVTLGSESHTHQASPPCVSIAQSRMRDGIRLIVIGGTETALAGGVDHGLLVRVALAGGVALDGSNRHALVRHTPQLRPGLQRGHAGPHKRGLRPCLRAGGLLRK